MFEEKREFIVKNLEDGCSIKEVFNMIDDGSDFYDLDTFYYYVREILHYKRFKADCEHCTNIIWVDSPTAKQQKPVCLAKKKILRTDFKDKPFKCPNYGKAEVDYGGKTYDVKKNH
ncbi:hypothetical protein QMP26_32500 [Enterocloster clostridioformis]